MTTRTITPEQREAKRAYGKAYMRKRRASMTSEQVEAEKAKRLEWYASRTPEQIEAEKAAQQKRLASRTEEQIEAAKAKQLEYWAVPERKEAKKARDRERYASRTPEEVEAQRAASREYYAKHKAWFKAYNRALRDKHKAMALEYLGGVCVRCGTDENLEFDHIDPTTKSFNIGGQLGRPWKTLKRELDKCQLLCRQPCHAEKTREDRREG